MIRVVAVFVIVVSGLAAAWMWFETPSSLPNQVVSERVAEMASKSLPFDIRWKSMAINRDPPEVALEDCELRMKPGDPLLMTAERVVLRAEPGSLEARQPRIEGVVLEGPRLSVVRSASGWEPWNFLGSDGGQKSNNRDRRDKTPELAPKASGGGLPFFRIERGTILFRDTALDPAMEWTLENVEVRGVQETAGQPYEIVGGAESSSGGTITLEGSVRETGKSEVNLSFSELLLAPLARYSKELSGFRAPVSGMAKVVVADSSWQKLSARLRSPKATLRVEEINLRGALELTLEIRPEPLGGASGKFDLDATDAALNLAGSYRKPAGSPAQVEGTFLFTPGGKLELDKVNLSIRKNRGSQRGGDSGKSL